MREINSCIADAFNPIIIVDVRITQRVGVDELPGSSAHGSVGGRALEIGGRAAPDVVVGILLLMNPRNPQSAGSVFENLDVGEGFIECGGE